MATTLDKYARLFAVQVRTSVALGMQYRFDFAINGFTSITWLAVTVIPLVVVFGHKSEIAEWTFPEALVVAGWFVGLKGLLEGAITPSLMTVVEHIRKGTLDFVLLKPADAQFLVSTAKFQPWCVVDVAGGIGVVIYAFHRLHTSPTLSGIGAGLALLFAAVAVIYSIWILVVSLAFFVVKVDNLTYLFQSVFDFARWPITVFPGVIRFVFTFVLPLAVMTSFPAQALLGKLQQHTALYSVVGAAAFSWIARQLWKASIQHYTGASS